MDDGNSHEMASGFATPKVAVSIVRYTDNSTPIDQGSDRKSVCLNFSYTTIFINSLQLVNQTCKQVFSYQQFNFVFAL